MSSRAVVPVVVAGCATAGRATQAVDAREHGVIDAPEAPDAEPGAPDARADAMPTFDAMTGGGGTHLLLSEVQLAPSTGEFIEIVNPTAGPVVLDDYYLSDNGTYWKLPAAAQTLDTGDFIVRFEAGSSIAAHAVITVALDTAANFQTADGVAPTYSIAGGTMTTVASSGTPGLTNTGEIVALFRWDGQSDLVTDIDIMIAGAATSGNGFVAKAGQAIDGPDAGSTTSTYAAEAGTIAAQAATPASGKSTKRLTLETGHESTTGGNGVGGDDESSEATNVTWDSSTFSAPTPGSVPIALQ